ncbi:MAG: hypothetical protein J6W38_03940 [Prevotella sp.]|jgi:hypothetical protein|nr:hypothetical protein [Prevotella sp.]
MEQIWTFFQTLAKGIVQGFRQFFANDLDNYVPLFIFAALVLIGSLLMRIIKKHKTK